jgi:hypothetical protein
VLKTFEWPKPIQTEGCVALDDPVFAFHPQKNVRSSFKAKWVEKREEVTSATKTNPNLQELLLDFLEEFGLMVVVNLKDGSSRYVKPRDPFFTGFENMHYVSHNIVKG